MKIIDQYHEVLHMDGLDRIERAGRTCYKSEDKTGCTLGDNRKCPGYDADESMFFCSGARDGLVTVVRLPSGRLRVAEEELDRITRPDTRVANILRSIGL